MEVIEGCDQALPGQAEPELVGSPTEHATVARRDFEPIAKRLAARIAPNLIAFRPGPALSSMARWFCDRGGQLLVVVVGGHERVDVCDEILAYALAWQHDRDLVLVLAESHVGVTLERLPWVDTPVRVFTYGADLEPRPAIVPSRAEVLARAALRPIRSTSTHDLKNDAALVETLVRRLDRHWALVRADRPSYLAWHCLGRQVIGINRSKTGVRIRAGVSYGKPAARRGGGAATPDRCRIVPGAVGGSRAPGGRRDMETHRSV